MCLNIYMLMLKVNLSLELCKLISDKFRLLVKLFTFNLYFLTYLVYTYLYSVYSKKYTYIGRNNKDWNDKRDPLPWWLKRVYIVYLSHGFRSWNRGFRIRWRASALPLPLSVWRPVWNNEVGYLRIFIYLVTN